MSAKESKKVFDMIGRKYEHNPTVSAVDKEKRLRYAQKRRDWETRRLYPDVGQPLMEKYVLRLAKVDVRHSTPVLDADGRSVWVCPADRRVVYK